MKEAAKAVTKFQSKGKNGKHCEEFDIFLSICLVSTEGR